MNILHDIYEKSVFENEKNVTLWEEHLQKLKNLNLSLFAEKLKIPTLVPIGSRILFRGELKHTNEVTVALGADYFAKCSIKQAEELRQHRIKVAQEKLDSFIKEREYLTNKISFNKQHVFDTNRQEILEVYTEEEDIAWREKHRENVRSYKQTQAKQECTVNPDEITDEDLWNRLDELELQEELEDELESMNRVAEENIDPFIIKEETIITPKEYKAEVIEKKEKILPSKEIKEALNQNSKLNLLQQVQDRQDELENKLMEMKHRDRVQSKTENDLIERLNQMEEIDELEDEMDRIDDIIQTEDAEVIEPEENINKQLKVKRCVSFADEDDSETLEITFTHSETEPDKTPYCPDKGIMKPSDIYDAHSNLFGSETTSILKKTNCVNYIPVVKRAEKKSDTRFEDEPVVNNTIVVKDVIEKAQQNVNKLTNGSRPASLFKKNRMQNKM